MKITEGVGAVNLDLVQFKEESKEPEIKVKPGS